MRPESDDGEHAEQNWCGAKDCFIGPLALGFDTEVSASQLLTPVGFSFPQGAFGTFPGTGPIPSVDTTVKVPMQPTMYEPLSQLDVRNQGVIVQPSSFAARRHFS